MSSINASRSLSVVIPTYNRAELLDICLEENIKVLSRHLIKIYVVDNCSTDNTAEVVSKHKAAYELLEYRCNSENLGTDRSFEIGLKLSETDYVWLLGDSYRLDSDGVNILISTIEEAIDYDLYLLNVDGSMQGIDKIEYTDANEVMAEFGWLMTCLSVLVYSRSVIESVSFKRYYDTSFLQTGILLEYLALNDFKIRWLGDCSVKSWINCIDLKADVWQRFYETHWQRDLIAVWYVKRCNFIFSLPFAYTIQNKINMARTIHVKSRATFPTLLSMREQGHLNLKVLYRDSDVLKLVLNKPAVLIFLVAIFPRWPLYLVRCIYRSMKLICVKV